MRVCIALVVVGFDIGSVQPKPSSRKCVSTIGDAIAVAFGSSDVVALAVDFAMVVFVLATANDDVRCPCFDCDYENHQHSR